MTGVPPVARKAIVLDGSRVQVAALTDGPAYAARQIRGTLIRRTSQWVVVQEDETGVSWELNVDYVLTVTQLPPAEKS